MVESLTVAILSIRTVLVVCVLSLIEALSPDCLGMCFPPPRFEFFSLLLFCLLLFSTIAAVFIRVNFSVESLPCVSAVA